MKLRKDFVKGKAHNVALYRGFPTREFVQYILDLLAAHRLEDLSDIDMIGRHWKSLE